MDKAGKARIEALENGPLTVENLSNFNNSRGEPIECSESVDLCRCGKSQTKPYCDETHKMSGYSSDKCKNRIADKKEIFKGKDITIYDNRGICSHAGFCTSLLPLVFHGGDPWIDPDQAEMKRIREVIEMCPSGALSYSVNEIETKDFFSKEKISVKKNGPYSIEGGIKVEDTDLGDDASLEHYTLCRCGDSCNKPRCDGSHWYSDFIDDESLTISKANRIGEIMEAEWLHAASIDAFNSTDKVIVNLNGRTIILTKIGETIGAIEGVCPHQGGPLYDGTLDGELILCPWHGHGFDRVTGRSKGKDHDIEAFDVDLRDDGNIYLKVSAPVLSQWTISHVMIETMVNWGISTVFGMVGHSNLGLAEAVRIQEGKDKIRFIGIRHEGAAAFAASGYAKASGKPAACLTIAGPGATNLLTGLWDAKVDRVPLLALTGQVQTQFFGPGAFQEIDLPAAFGSVTGFSQTVLPSSKHGELMSLAIKHALVNREVAHLIFPDEIQTLDAEDEGPGLPDGRLSPDPIKPPEESLVQAQYRINAAKRPVIIVGCGARDNMEEIISLAEKLDSPILTTFKAKGQISDFHPLGCGVLGRSGTPVASTLMSKSDLLIVFGSSFSQHTGIDSSKPIIQVDFDRMALGKFHPVSSPVWGDCGITASLFMKNITENPSREDSRNEISNLWKSWKKEKTLRASKDDGKGINSAIIFKELSELVDEDALISVDVGNNTYSYGRYFESRKQQTIMSGYLGSIGFSFPAAMGAWATDSGRQIISISGDGGFGQYMVEFLTAVKYEMNITHILLHNDVLGKISKEQRAGGWQVWKTDLKNPSFSEYAKISGGFGIRVDSTDNLGAAVKEAINYNGPSIVEIMTDPELI